MPFETRSKSQINKQKWKEENKEDDVRLLEEVLFFEPEETFYKIFNTLTKMGIDTILKLYKENLESLTWKEDNRDISSLMKFEVGEIHNLMRYVEHIKQKGEFPSETSKFRFNTITQESYFNFKYSSIIFKKENFNDFKSADSSKRELDYHLNSRFPETLKLPPETSKTDHSHETD